MISLALPVDKIPPPEKAFSPALAPMCDFGARQWNSILGAHRKAGHSQPSSHFHQFAGRSKLIKHLNLEMHRAIDSNDVLFDEAAE